MNPEEHACMGAETRTLPPAAGAVTESFITLQARAEVKAAMVNDNDAGLWQVEKLCPKATLLV
jgi:hypothetical protein